MPPSEIRRAAEKIIASKSVRWRTFLSGSEARDAIEYSAKGNVAETFQYRLRDPRRHILTRLGHVAVNPHNALNTSMLIRSYVYSGSSPSETTRGEIVVNRDPASTRHFVERLVELAEDARSISEDNEDIPDPTGKLFSTEKCMLLFGKKGSGKTFF